MTRVYTQRCLDYAAAQVAAQKSADDLVIAGMQNSIEALATELAACRDTLALAQTAVADLTARLAAAQVIIDEDGAHIADLTSQLVAAEQRIAELEAELGQDPPGTALFGALCGVLKGSGESKGQARARVTALYGGMPVERIYLATAFDPVLVNVGHSVIATWAFPGDLSDVAAGAYDARITTFAAAWKGPGTLYLGPNHEPDQDGRPYTAAQFAAAAARVMFAIQAAGNPLVKTTVILMSYTLTKGPDAWKAWYYGYGHDVDVQGWDAYWRPTTQRTAEAVYGPCRDAAASWGMPWLIGETSMGALHNLGSMQRDTWDPIPEAEWAQFVSDGIALLSSSGCVAVTWFETNLVDGDGRLANHPDALALWKAAVAASHA